VRAADVLAFGAGALRGHGLRSGLSLTGVAIGIAAVVLLTALGEGARRYVIEQFAAIGSDLIAILPGKVETQGAIPGLGGTTHDLTLEDVAALRRSLPNARYVEPLVVGTETVSHGERRRQVLVAGVAADFVHVRRLTLERGRFLPRLELDRGAPVAVLGATVAAELFPGGDPIGRVVRIGGRRCRVIGVLAERGKQLGMDMDEVTLIPVATAMQLFNRSSLFRVLVSARPGASLDHVAERAHAVLIERHRGEDDVTILTEEAVVSSLSAILTVLTLALGAIAAISLAVAGVGIMNVMLVSVSERTGEIGLLKAVGASRGEILSCFLTESALLSTAGGLLGLAVGWLGVGILVRIFPALPAAPPGWAVAAALILSVLVGTVFGYLPARRATRLDPVAALAGH
jgi:putative ABC transport system permease protein